MPAKKKAVEPKDKSLESWIWDAACSISGTKDAPKYKDFTMFPNRYLHTADAETYRPIAEIVEELNAIEAAAKQTDKGLRKIFKQPGV